MVISLFIGELLRKKSESDEERRRVIHTSEKNQTRFGVFVGEMPKSRKNGTAGGS
jgi:hypothetical protein